MDPHTDHPGLPSGPGPGELEPATGAAPGLAPGPVPGLGPDPGSGGSDFEMLAASLRADAGDLPTFVEVFAGKLEGALGARVQVERHAKKLLSHDKVVRMITVALGDMRYTLTSDPPGVIVTMRAKAVRGIVLKSERLELAPWIESLARDLAAEAQSSEQARMALQRLLL